MAALVLIAVALAVDTSAPLIVGAVFILVVPFEKLFPRHRQRIRRPDLGTDIGYALAGGVLNIVGLIVAVPVAVLSLAWIPGWALRPLVSMVPPVMVPVIGLLLFDLAIYWTHRWYHEVPVLWRFHAIHHSTERLDWVSGFRTHPLDGTLIAPAVIFLLAAGFSPEVTGVLAVVQVVIGIFLHANVRWRLRPLHRLVITPEFHHWHHANEPEAINSNYSVFLPGLGSDVRHLFHAGRSPTPALRGQRVHPQRDDLPAPTPAAGPAAATAPALVRDPSSMAVVESRHPTRPTSHPRSDSPEWTPPPFQSCGDLDYEPSVGTKRASKLANRSRWSSSSLVIRNRSRTFWRPA